MNLTHVKSFKMARDRLKDKSIQNLKLKLISDRHKDDRIYNISMFLKLQL